MADRLLTSGIACRFVASSAPVYGSYDVLAGGVIGRRDCTVRDPDDIPSARTLADVQDLVATLKSAYLQGNASLFREETVTPKGDQGGDPFVVPHGLLLGFYLRVLAKTFASDASGALARTTKDLNAIVSAVLMKPDRRPPNSTGQYMEESIVGVAEIVKATPVADLVAWPFLWSWASDTHSQPRTRVFAMQALEKIISRGTVAANAKMLAQVETLRQSLDDWDSMWPTYSDTDKRERALTVAQANSTIATAAAKLAENGLNVAVLTPIPMPPVPSSVPWVPLLGVGVGSVGLVILALWARGRGRKVPRKPVSRPRRPRRG